MTASEISEKNSEKARNVLLIFSNSIIKQNSININHFKIFPVWTFANRWFAEGSEPSILRSSTIFSPVHYQCATLPSVFQQIPYRVLHLEFQTVGLILSTMALLFERLCWNTSYSSDLQRRNAIKNRKRAAMVHNNDVFSSRV